MSDMNCETEESACRVSERLVCDLHETVVDSAELAALRLAMHAFDQCAKDLEAAQAELAALRECAEKAERALQQAHVEATLEDVDRTTTEQRLRDENADLRASLARYEAPGPALLTIDHGPRATFKECTAALTGTVASYEDVNQGCICDAYAIAGAYREQHARCKAVVSRVAWQSAESEHSHGEDAVREAAFAAGVRAALAALTGEAEK